MGEVVLRTCWEIRIDGEWRKIGVMEDADSTSTEIIVMMYQPTIKLNKNFTHDFVPIIYALLHPWHEALNNKLPCKFGSVLYILLS